jgi:hypothetical protein
MTTRKKVDLLILILFVIVLAIGIAIPKLTVRDLVSVNPNLKRCVAQSLVTHYDNPLEHLGLYLGKSRIVSADIASAEIESFTMFRIPLGIFRGDINSRLGVSCNMIDPNDSSSRIIQPDGNNELPTPDDKIKSQIQETIRNFMADPTLEINYISTKKNPSNFTVGKVTPVDNNPPGTSGAWSIETPKEWERPTYVFQQTEYIDNLCEVYEYEIDARNNELIEVHVKYPQIDMESSQEAKAKKCANYGSLYTPLKTKAQIETIAMDYLSRAITNFDQIKSQFVFKPSTKNAINAPAANEWFWQDTSYKLPEDLSGDVYNYPTIRIIISSGGKLIYYFNSVGLFKN